MAAHAPPEQQGTGWPTPIPWSAGDDAPAPASGKHRAWPPVDWPTQAQLVYTKELVTVILLLLALPWLVGKLLTRPGDLLEAAGRKQVANT